MAKFPSQNKILYQTGNISHDNYGAMAGTAGGGELCLPKDLSVLNRRGYASTTRKGVPLVYKCKVDFYLHDEDGQGPSTALASDMQATLKLNGVQNNWVVRNAAVKWHAAREEMFRKAQIKKGDRGAYSHEIRYNYSSSNDTFMIPIDGDGDALTGGTWDKSDITTDDDASIALKLVGPSDINEEAGATGTVLNIAHSYLMSRNQVPLDTNPQMDETPAEFSVLNQMLNPTGFALDSFKDDVILEAETAQDNPPYELIDVSDTGDLNHDITEPVELGRAIAGFGNSYGSMIVDIPFGIGEFKSVVYQATDPTITPKGLICLEVLDIYEMQG